jgi:DNA-directed RNA polymerase II subunit RPB2
MDVPQHVLRSLFRDTAFPLIQHHVDSYNDMLDARIPTFLRASNPFELELPDKRYIRIWMGGKNADKLKWVAPTDEMGNAVLPHGCRLDNTTYAVTLIADLEVDYVFPEGRTVTKVFTAFELGKIPLMLRSRLCYLTGVDGYTVGECRFELGGYFIIDGSEKVLLTQEKLGNNLFYCGKRTQVPDPDRPAGPVEKADEFVVSKPEYVDKQEYYAAVRSVSEDASRGPFSHFLVIPPNVLPSSKTETRFAIVTIPGFENPVPVFSVFRALGLTTDKDIYDTVLAGINDHDRVAYDDLFYSLMLSHDVQLTSSSDLDMLVEQTRTRSRPEVLRCLNDLLFPHVEADDDTGSLFRRKAYQLGRLLRMAMEQALALTQPTDRDHFKFKRLQTSGDLCFGEFRRIFRDIARTMLLELDKRVNQFERVNFAGDKLVNVLQPENLSFYWKRYKLLGDFLKSFKGSWGGAEGIAQELSRVSYAGVISHLRRTNLAMDRTSNKKEPRRFHASQMGILCPVDSPDGRNIGYIKALAIMARISTPLPMDMVRAMIKPFIRPITSVHPSTWQPTWTPVFINSDLAGVCIGRTEEMHAHLVKERRTRKLTVSLGWDRVANVYTLTCDGGRPIRPVYREGATADKVRAAKDWSEISDLIDYLDAHEQDITRLSIEPFHPTLQSEIHALFALSALTGLIPFSDHNPGTRNAFAIAQMKQTCSWFHTNYLKRYDTIAVTAVLPQIPLTQTWVYREIMGAGGCMPHGENALVAVTTYAGFNQEDSVMINAASMKRGMFQTVYYHSYDFMEDMTDPATQIHTEFANPAVNPLYKESVKRKEGLNYDHLDSEGVIMVGTEMTEDMILVGIVAPIQDINGKITGYRDVSEKPKRGQHGRVESVYRYATRDGLKGVKIRVAEERYPVLGDKLGSRHSQKGTLGMILPEEDMPFTARGVRPDVLFNPHALPTRMTIGHWMESSWSRLALKLGSFVDATPFTTSESLPTLKRIMMEQGFEPYGTETLYNGQTGEMMEADIFMGPTYYQRMKHMVEDKVNARATGPRKLLTHQPLEGRADEGGLRIGEMERDALIGHGMSKFTRESMMERSDAHTFQINRETEQLDTSRDMINMPYCMGLYTRELESMHITVRMKTE